MLDAQKIGEIQALVRAGELPHREIARRAGVSRGTVHAVANGYRQAKTRRPIDDQPPPDFEQPARRCRGCGGLVHPPCRLCQVRRLKALDLDRGETGFHSPRAGASLSRRQA